MDGPNMPAQLKTLWFLVATLLLLGCGAHTQSPDRGDKSDARHDEVEATMDSRGPDLESEVATAVGCAVPGQTCDDGNPCTLDECSPATGVCAHQPIPGPCDDQSLCTQEDTCSDGQCVGQPITCNDDNDCTMDTCDPVAGCQTTELNGACNDADPCTVNDHCSGGLCHGDAVVCDALEPCQVGSCNPVTGQCEYVAVTSPESCDDHDACTTGETCAGGSCGGGTPLDCGDGNPCTDDLCDAQSGCFSQFNSAPCDDGNPCTLGDICSQGECFPGPGKACQDGNPCTTDFCDESGQCQHLDNDWPCDDGNACTTQDVCQAGLCAGVAISCDDSNPCTADACEADTGCLWQPISAPCDDNNPCTLGDSCQQGQCLPGAATVSCDDQNPCTDDLCHVATGECLHLPNNAPCDDGNACTLGDTCADAVCVAGDTGACQCATDADCAVFDDDNLCNGKVICDISGFPPKCKLDVTSVVSCSPVFNTQCRHSECQPESGLCLLVDADDGTACDDDNPCSLVDQCTSGLCVGSNWADCNDANPCTKEVCDPEAGCLFTALNIPCDDSNLCTLGDLCVGGNCIGTPLACEDGNPCTVGVCQPDSGECSFPQALGSCDDENPCTVDDQCVGGVCIGTPADCDDQNPCTADACLGSDGCVHEIIGGSCDDGNACTAIDGCQNGKCKGTPIVCNDGNPCTDDLCSMAEGCLHPNNVAPCNDGDQCTYGDQCVDGECVGLEVICDDLNPCTDTYCHSQAGCIIEHLNVPCSDGSLCTVGDWCVDGTCVAGPPPVCDDGNPCTLDSCDHETGECVYGNTGWGCDDGNKCTTDDFCFNGACTGFKVDCDDQDLCTADSCDSQAGCFHQFVPGATCSDGNHCTTGDICVVDQCVGQDVVECDDANICTEDSCSPLLGCLFDGLTGGPCDDGDDATVADACLEGSCVGWADEDEDAVPDEGPFPVCQSGTVAPCRDNCLDLANPDQADDDDDGIGDLCESCGPVQSIDGETAPADDIWTVTVVDACPELNQTAVATYVDDQAALQFTATRDADCGSDTVKLALANTYDLSGANTVIAMDLALAATVYPGQFLGKPIGHFALSNGVDSVTLRDFEGNQVKGDCGNIATVPDDASRAIWTVTVDGEAQTALLSLDGVPDGDGPVSLDELEPPWQLEIGLLAGDLVGGCGGTAAITVFSYDLLCQW